MRKVHRDCLVVIGQARDLLLLRRRPLRLALGRRCRIPLLRQWLLQLWLLQLWLLLRALGHCGCLPLLLLWLLQLWLPLLLSALAAVHHNNNILGVGSPDPAETGCVGEPDTAGEHSCGTVKRESAISAHCAGVFRQWGQRKLTLETLIPIAYSSKHSPWKECPQGRCSRVP